MTIQIETTTIQDETTTIHLRVEIPAEGLYEAIGSVVDQSIDDALRVAVMLELVEDTTTVLQSIDTIFETMADACCDDMVVHYMASFLDTPERREMLAGALRMHGVEPHAGRASAAECIDDAEMTCGPSTAEHATPANDEAECRAGRRLEWARTTLAAWLGREPDDALLEEFHRASCRLLDAMSSFEDTVSRECGLGRRAVGAVAVRYLDGLDWLTEPLLGRITEHVNALVGCKAA